MKLLCQRSGKSLAVATVRSTLANAEVDRAVGGCHHSQHPTGFTNDHDGQHCENLLEHADILSGNNLEVVSWQLCLRCASTSSLLPSFSLASQHTWKSWSCGGGKWTAKKHLFFVENEPVSLKQFWTSTKGETEVFLVTWIHEIAGSAKAEPLPGMTRYWRGPIAQKSKLLRPRSLKRIRGCMLLYDADLMRRFNSRH